jgi:hypothetical protein
VNNPEEQCPVRSWTKKTRSVSATVAEPVYEQLVALSTAEDTSIARIIRRALREFLESHSRDANTDLPARRA